MKLTREDRERIEERTLASYATWSSMAGDRDVPCDPDPLRTVFQRDRDRILHSKSFRRLSHKTQVFIAPIGDHYRTRLTHTLEVAQISRTVARALRLNEDLTEAIALGHDLGHTPFGHIGEKALSACIAQRSGLDVDTPEAAHLYKHNRQSLRVVEVLEKNGRGLNLTPEVRDGIVHHTGNERAGTLEGRIVAIADRIAYVNHDIDDAIRAAVISEDDLPEHAHELLGETHSQRITSLVCDLVDTSDACGDIMLSEDSGHALQELRQFLFDNVYTSPVAKGEDGKAFEFITMLFWHYIEHPDEVPDEQIEIARQHPSDVVPDDPLSTAIVDYIAGMTDRYARDVFAEVFIPKKWHRRS